MLNVNNLFLEIQSGNNELVREAVNELGIEVKDTYGRTPLINAAFYGNMDLLKWLISEGADVNARDKKGYAALHFSVQENKSDCVNLLLKSKADPNIQDENGNTPAAVAVLNWKAGENFGNLKALIDAGADLKLKNKAGNSVYSIIPVSIKKQLGL